MILQVVQPYLEIVAIDNSLIKPQECVPRLVGIADDAKALARVSPEKRISDICVEHGGVTESKPFAVVDVSLFRSIAWQEWGARVAQILERATPEQQMPAVRRETIIKAGDEDIVVQACGCAKNESSIIEPVPCGKIVGYGATGTKRLVEITGVIG